MSRRIAIRLGKATLTAQLLEEEAPRTCQAIWELLPLEGQAKPGLVSGSEAYLTLKGGSGIPFENQTIYPIPGDIVFYLQPSTYVDPEVGGAERHRETIGVMYGLAQVCGPVVPLPLNLFATAVEGLSEFSAEVARMRREGFGPLTISRVESGEAR